MLFWLFLHPNSPSGNSCLFAQALALPESPEHTYIPQGSRCPQRPCDAILLQRLPSTSSSGSHPPPPPFYSVLVLPMALREGEAAKQNPAGSSRCRLEVTQMTGLAAGSRSLAAILPFPIQNPSIPRFSPCSRLRCHPAHGLPQSHHNSCPSATVAPGNGTGTARAPAPPHSEQPFQPKARGFPSQSTEKAPTAFFPPCQRRGSTPSSTSSDIAPGEPRQERAGIPTSHLWSRSRCGKEPAYHLVAVSSGKPKPWITRLGVF